MLLRFTFEYCCQYACRCQYAMRNTHRCQHALSIHLIALYLCVSLSIRVSLLIRNTQYAYRCQHVLSIRISLLIRRYTCYCVLHVSIVVNTRVVVNTQYAIRNTRVVVNYCALHAIARYKCVMTATRLCWRAWGSVHVIQTYVHLLYTTYSIQYFMDHIWSVIYNIASRV